MKSKKLNTVLFGGVAALAGAIYVSGFNPIADLDAKRSRAVKANIAEFDPEKDLDFDMNKWGTELPDEYDIETAFSRSLEKMDGCVISHKSRAKMGEDDVLEGEAFLAVKLDPKRGRPAGVNVTLPDAIETDKKLSKCIRDVAYKVGYPKYDGPPRVVNLSFELDPGYEMIDD
ncbi:MAG: hypothetical protein ACPHRO_05380 [Nannocystaceae bacterium]